MGRIGRLAVAAGLSLLAASESLAQSALPPDVAQRLNTALQAAERSASADAGIYAGLGNPALADRKASQARERANADAARAVLAAMSERPDLGAAIVNHATGAAPAAAASIRAAAGSAYPALGLAAPATGAAVPQRWYPPVESATRYVTPGTPGPMASAAAAPSIPMNWYDQPSLRRYGGGAPAYPQPPLPPGVAPGPDRVSVAQAAGGAAAAPADAGPAEIWDPLEPINRGFNLLNQGLDFILLRPVAKIYSYVPAEIKGMVRNALFNLNEPLHFANNLLQGEVGLAAQTVGRFVVNTTIGIGGLAEAADPIFGLKPARADLGQTFYVWGAGPGPYIEAPLIGPTNARDLLGFTGQFFADPWGYVVLDQTARYVRAGATVVSAREQLLEPLDQLKENSVDYYVSLREASQARRQVELDRGKGRPAGAGPSAVDKMFDEAK